MRPAAAEAVPASAALTFRPHLVPVEPDAVEWCRTFWRQMHERLRRLARDHERQAERAEALAVELSLWMERDFPWTGPARTSARVDAYTGREAAAVCREGAAYARGNLAELSRGLDIIAADEQSWEGEGGALGALPVEPFAVEPEVLARAKAAGERDGKWSLGPRLPIEGVSAIRIPDTGRLAERRADFGFPPVFELTDPDHEGAADESRHSRFFRLDGAGDWPRIVEATDEVKSMLANRLRLRQSDVAAEERRQRHTAVASNEALDYLKGKRQDGLSLVVDFQREGRSGAIYRTVRDEDGEICAPEGETRTPLQLLRAAHRIDPGQYSAGEVFAEHFLAARFNLGKGTDYADIKGGGFTSSEPEVPPEVQAEREWIHGAMNAMGGGASPYALAVWLVVGAQATTSAFAMSRHFQMPGGQRWLTDAEARNALRTGLAALRAHLDAPTVEFQNRRHGLRIRPSGSVELSFLVGSRRFKVVAQFQPGRKAWIGTRMAPRKPVPGRQAGSPTEFRHWCVRGQSLADVVEASIAVAGNYCKLIARQERTENG